MGFFDLFKNKQTSTQEKSKTQQKDSLTDFDCYYLYGFTDNPYRQSNDFKSFGELYKKVIGEKGGIVIGSSFHPYQLVNSKGATVWHVGYIQLYANKQKEEAFHSIINESGLVLVNPSAAFKDILIWPDTRLTNEENPIFSTYVPFVIPFLVYKSKEQINWDIEITIGVATEGNASEYLKQINNDIRFFMPEPSFVIGFDKFDEAKPSQLIDNIINCKKLFGQ